MKKLLIILSLIWNTASAQPTFFGVASVPADNGTSALDPTAFSNPPVASMAAGDLCIIYAGKRNATGAISISNTGGQSWNSVGTKNGAFSINSANVLWCRFNGTWSAAPSVSFGATTCNSAVMLVFRPVTSTNYWYIIDPTSGFQWVDFSAAASLTSTGWTPSHNNTVNLSIVHTDDDNTFTFTGTNWSKTSISAQYRNTSGTDQSISIAYQIQGTAAATNNCIHTEATLGNDPAIGFRSYWYEAAPPSYNKKGQFLQFFKK